MFISNRVSSPRLFWLWGQINLCCRTARCIVGCLAAPWSLPHTQLWQPEISLGPDNVSWGPNPPWSENHQFIVFYSLRLNPPAIMNSQFQSTHCSLYSVLYLPCPWWVQYSSPSFLPSELHPSSGLAEKSEGRKASITATFTVWPAVWKSWTFACLQLIKP